MFSDLLKIKDVLYTIIMISVELDRAALIEYCEEFASE